ncbi:O-antigen ligase family protein [bacterium]|nr:O-antigen ligase family protein [bacterium]
MNNKQTFFFTFLLLILCVLFFIIFFSGDLFKKGKIEFYIYPNSFAIDLEKSNHILVRIKEIEHDSGVPYKKILCNIFYKKSLLEKNNFFQESFETDHNGLGQIYVKLKKIDFNKDIFISFEFSHKGEKYFYERPVKLVQTVKLKLHKGVNYFYPGDQLVERFKVENFNKLYPENKLLLFTLKNKYGDVIWKSKQKIESEDVVFRYKFGNIESDQKMEYSCSDSTGMIFSKKLEVLSRFRKLFKIGFERKADILKIILRKCSVLPENINKTSILILTDKEKVVFKDDVKFIDSQEYIKEFDCLKLMQLFKNLKYIQVLINIDYNGKSQSTSLGSYYISEKPYLKLFISNNELTEGIENNVFAFFVNSENKILDLKAKFNVKSKKIGNYYRLKVNPGKKDVIKITAEFGKGKLVESVLRSSRTESPIMYPEKPYFVKSVDREIKVFFENVKNNPLYFNCYFDDKISESMRIASRGTKSIILNNEVEKIRLQLIGVKEDRVEVKEIVLKNSDISNSMQVDIDDFYYSGNVKNQERVEGDKKREGFISLSKGIRVFILFYLGIMTAALLLCFKRTKRYCRNHSVDFAKFIFYSLFLINMYTISFLFANKFILFILIAVLVSYFFVFLDYLPGMYAKHQLNSLLLFSISIFLWVFQYLNQDSFYLYIFIVIILNYLNISFNAKRKIFSFRKTLSVFILSMILLVLVITSENNIGRLKIYASVNQKSSKNIMIIKHTDNITMKTPKIAKDIESKSSVLPFHFSFPYFYINKSSSPIGFRFWNKDLKYNRIRLSYFSNKYYKPAESYGNNKFNFFVKDNIELDDFMVMNLNFDSNSVQSLTAESSVTIDDGADSINKKNIFIYPSNDLIYAYQFSEKATKGLIYTTFENFCSQLLSDFYQADFFPVHQEDTIYKTISEIILLEYLLKVSNKNNVIMMWVNNRKKVFSKKELFSRISRIFEKVYLGRNKYDKKIQMIKNDKLRSLTQKYFENYMNRLSVGMKFVDNKLLDNKFELIDPGLFIEKKSNYYRLCWKAVESSDFISLAFLLDSFGHKKISPIFYKGEFVKIDNAIEYCNIMHGKDEKDGEIILEISGKEKLNDKILDSNCFIYLPEGITPDWIKNSDVLTSLRFNHRILNINMESMKSKRIVLNASEGVHTKLFPVKILNIKLDQNGKIRFECNYQIFDEYLYGSNMKTVHVPLENQEIIEKDL